MNNLCNAPEKQTGSNQNTRTVTPLADIHETADGYIVEAEMPGVNRDGLEITLENDELAIVGRRSPGSPAGTALHRETRRFDYRRIFELNTSVDSARISARIEQGILKLHLPKSEAVKPRRIAVLD